MATASSSNDSGSPVKPLSPTDDSGSLVKPSTLLGEENPDAKNLFLHFGTSKADTFNGKNTNDTYFGERGDDILKGNGGNDILDGDKGNDTLYGGAGNDILYGDSEDDKLFGGIGNDILDGGKGQDHLEGGSGDDKLYGDEGRDKLYGGKGNDYLDGGADNDFLDGGSGNDILKGGHGVDVLLGGEGDDLLFGEINDALLEGASGSDLMQVDMSALKNIRLEDIVVTVDGGDGSAQDMDVLLAGADSLSTIKALLKSGHIVNTELLVSGNVERDSVSDVLARLQIVDADNDGKYILHGWQLNPQTQTYGGKEYVEATKHVGSEELTILIQTWILENY